MRKVAEKRVDQEGSSETSSHLELADVAAGLAGGAVGAVVGGNLGKTNGAAVAAAAIGAFTGVLLSPAVRSCATEEEMSGVVLYLRQHLGPRVTAYLSGADDVALVDLWAEGKASPEEIQDKRLKLAYKATRYVVDAYGDVAARSWFLGTNDLLDRDSPASVLRHGEKPQDWELVIPAARELVENAR